jgi:mannonate dehydratase
MRLEDGSTTLAYDDGRLAEIDLSKGTGQLPGWGSAYTAKELAELRDAYDKIDEEQPWENLKYFLQRVAPNRRGSVAILNFSESHKLEVRRMA